MIYAAEVSYFDTTLKTEYFATEAFTTSGASAPAHRTFLPRVVTPALLRRDIFDVGATGGASRVGYGELVLANDDGVLDVFNTYGLDGRTLIIRVADSPAAAYPSAWTTLFLGSMEQIEVTLTEVRIRIRDRQVFAGNAFQTNRYGGTNVLPNGLDGLPSDLAGKPKPITLGAVFNIEPPCVNTSRLIYQVHDGQIRGVNAVYDAGAYLTQGELYASQAEMLSTEPAAGTYRAWLEGGMFRLGSSPYGQVTADVIEGLEPRFRTAAALFRRVLEAAGVGHEQISAPDCVALDALNNATLGVYVTDDTTNADVLDDITRSVGAWWASDTAGVLRIQRLEAPSGAPAISLTASNIVDGTLSRVPLNNGGLPVYRVTARGAQNWTVQSTGLVGSVPSARRARLAQAFKTVTATDGTVQTTNLLAPEIVVETRLACVAAVTAEAARLLTLYKVKRDRFEARVVADAAMLNLIDLGVVVEITLPRFGLDSGKLFRIIGYQLDPSAGTAALTLWG